MQQVTIISSVVTQSRVIEWVGRGVVVDGCRGSVVEHLWLKPEALCLTPLWHHISFFLFAVLKVLGHLYQSVHQLPLL